MSMGQSERRIVGNVGRFCPACGHPVRATDPHLQRDDVRWHLDCTSVRIEIAEIGLNRLRKARIGWWVDGNWCPTKAIRDHALARRGGIWSP